MAKVSAPAPRAAIYARQSVSAEDGIKLQVKRCRALAEARDYEVVEIFEDNAVSGYSERGEGTAFDRMLAAARDRRFDVLLVRKVDRLGRSLAALEALTKLRVPIVTVDGELDLSTPSGRLVANLVTAVAQNESEVKAERRVNMNKERRANGFPTSGRVPYGYKWIPTAERDAEDPQAYALDGQRAADVRRIYDAFLAGVPLGSIARDLTTDKRRTLGTRRRPDGVPFTATTLRRMLMSPYYAGLLPIPSEDGAAYDQNTITRDRCEPGRWPAIVTVEEWEAAKAKLAHPDRKTSPGPTRRHLLSGLAICGADGCADSDGRPRPILAGGGEKGVHSYRCPSMRHFMRRGDPLDAYVERFTVEYIAQHRAALLAPRDRRDSAKWAAELARLDSAIVELGEDRDAGDIDRAEYVRRRAGLVKKRDEHRRALAETVDRSALEGIVDAEDVLATWRGLTLGQKRAILSDLFEIRVHSVGQGNRRNMPADKFAKTVTITPAT